jgi:hypothetical protein
MKILLVMTFLLSSFAYAGTPINACSALFEDRVYDAYYRNKYIIPDDVKLYGKPIKDVIGERVKKITRKAFTGETFEDAIEQVYKQAKTKSGFKKQSKVMSDFAKDMNDVFEEMIAKFPQKGTLDDPDLIAWIARKEAIEEVKSIKFKMAKKISKIENFKPSEFQTVGKKKFLLTNPDVEPEKLTHMQLDEYADYTESWVYRNWKGSDHPKAKLFEQIDEGNLGVLDVGDIRDIEAYNLWPMYLKEHDMRHIHYGYSHPMALAVMMESARSKEHVRFVMMGSLYEGVDRVQYSHETAINKWFSSQVGSSELLGIERNMDLEEAMITIALSSEDDLWKIAKNMGHESSVRGWVDELKDWKPKIVEGTQYTGKALNGKALTKDVYDNMKKYSKYVQKGELSRRKLLEEQSLELTEKQELFMKMQNYQLDPENPEIVIDGLRYKNDGRGHYYGDGADGGPIGIGDQ